MNIKYICVKCGAKKMVILPFVPLDTKMVCRDCELKDTVKHFHMVGTRKDA